MKKLDTSENFLPMILYGGVYVTTYGFCALITFSFRFMLPRITHEKAFEIHTQTSTTTKLKNITLVMLIQFFVKNISIKNEILGLILSNK